MEFSKKKIIIEDIINEIIENDSRIISMCEAFLPYLSKSNNPQHDSIIDIFTDIKKGNLKHMIRYYMQKNKEESNTIIVVLSLLLFYSVMLSNTSNDSDWLKNIIHSLYLYSIRSNESIEQNNAEIDEYCLLEENNTDSIRREILKIKNEAFFSFNEKNPIFVKINNSSLKMLTSLFDFVSSNNGMVNFILSKESNEICIIFKMATMVNIVLILSLEEKEMLSLFNMDPIIQDEVTCIIGAFMSMSLTGLNTEPQIILIDFMEKKYKALIRDTNLLLFNESD